MVTEFHRKFGLTVALKPRMLTQEEFDFRLRRLQEEVDEFVEAYLEGDLPKMADALVDLNYISHGTAAMMGVPWADVMAAVHRANMTKERAKRPEDSKHGTTMDIVKPAGWTPPDVAGVLRAHGWQG